MFSIVDDDYQFLWLELIINQSLVACFSFIVLLPGGKVERRPCCLPNMARFSKLYVIFLGSLLSILLGLKQRRVNDFENCHVNLKLF